MNNWTKPGKFRLIVILGPTASGKTELAARLAHKISGEIISADSRQVYRRMTIGTGKDLEDYTIDGTPVPFHLIDIAEPGYEYNVFEFLKDFRNAFNTINEHGKIPVLCGGSGMYIDAVVNGYKMKTINTDPDLMEALQTKSDDELREILKHSGTLHNTTDLTDRVRMIRAILIPKETKSEEIETSPLPDFDPVLIGINFNRDQLRKRITERLEKRIQNGMIKEVEQLLKEGLTPGQLKFYGLEYRYITSYLESEISYDEMFRLLNIAIHQFSKRQMTWYRKMEREGKQIHWIDGTLGIDEKIRLSMDLINN